jgi:hypothetical protein
MNHMTNQFLEEIFAFDEQINAFPITFNVISKAQVTNNKIQVVNYKQCNDPDFETRIIQEALLVYFKGKITIPTNLHSHVLTWNHKNLLHPGAN